MKTSISGLLAAAALALATPVRADIYSYIAMPLTASQEASTSNSSGYGSVTALYDSGTKVLVYSIAYQLNPDSSATAAHFHGPAPLGANAGVAIALPTQPTGNVGKLTGTVTLTPAQEADLLAGNWYFNIHSTLAAAGELRAQLIENSTTLPLPLYSNSILSLPVVLVPGIAGPDSYSGTLTYPGTGTAFELTSATAFR